MTPNIQTKLKQARRLQKAGDFARAESIYQKLLKRVPESGEVHQGIARVYRAIGKFDFATAHFNQAIALGLHSAEIFAENASVLNHMERYTEAETMASAAITLDPTHRSAHRQMLKAMLTQGKYKEAIPVAQQLLHISPNTASDRIMAAWLNTALEQHDAAIAQAEKAIELDATYADAYYLLSRVFKNVQQWDKAVEFADKACELAPDNDEYIAQKADMLEHRGQFEEAYALVKPLIDKGKPYNGVAVHVYSELAGRFGKREHAVQLLENLAAESSDFVGMKYATLSMLGAHYDSLGEYDKAFAAIDKANKLRPSRYSDEQVEAYINDIVNWFTGEKMSQAVTASSDEAQPIFIVGMPRSGTSLTEKILSRHADVHAGGETIHLPKVLHQKLPSLLHSEQSFPECLESLTPELAQQAAEEFLSRVCEGAAVETSRVTEKRPMNYVYLGAIAQLFPNAKIIHVTRNPLDIALSCYFANFASSSELGFSQDFELFAAYYKRYEQVMAHWHKVLPLEILDLSYESLVTEPDAEIRKLLEFCDLSWDENCLNPQDSTQVTMTASYNQVRKPINTSSIGRWKRYERHLAPLQKALGLLDSEAA